MSSSFLPPHSFHFDLAKGKWVLIQGIVLDPLGYNNINKNVPDLKEDAFYKDYIYRYACEHTCDCIDIEGIPSEQIPSTNADQHSNFYF